MFVSLNQIEQTSRKAAKGAGLTWGVADDLGKAVRWLSALGLDGSGALLQMLQQCRFNEARCSRSTQKVDSVGVGLAIADLSGSTTACNELPKQVCFPLIAAALAAMNLQLRQQPVALAWGKASIHVIADNVYVNGLDIDLMTKQTGDFNVLEAKPIGIAKLAVAGEQSVNTNVLRALESFAHRTYVEATDASRLAGAGAGLNDND